MESTIVKANVKSTIYDLKNGIPKNFSNLSTSLIYLFCISAKYYEFIDIEFTKNDTLFSNYQEIIIYEYEYEGGYSQYYLTKKNLSLSYNSIKNSYSLSYTVNSFKTNSVGFEINPKYQMNSINVIANVTSLVYKLINEIPIYLDILSSSYIYLFYISARKYELIDIEFSKIDTLFTNSQPITIYEYQWESFCSFPGHLIKQNLTLSYNSIKNSYSLSYNVNSSRTNYVAFEINPNYQMNSTYITANIMPLVYNLTNENPIYLDILFTSYTYLFHITAKYSQYIDIKFSKTDKLSTNSQNIIIYEYKSGNLEYSLTGKNSNLSYDTTQNCYTLSYIVEDFYTKFVGFELNPYYQMNFTSVTASIGTAIYDLINNNSEYLGNLDSSHIYKFNIGAEINHFVDIEFT